MLYSGIKTSYPNDGPLPEEAHPVWRPHLFQGWATDFVPQLVGEAVEELGDNVELHPTTGFRAMETSQALATHDAIFSGTSGGGIVYAALELAKKSPPGTNILAIVPDTAERYLSTPLFADIPADMTAEEKELAASTPSEAPPPPGLPGKTPESIEFVKSTNVEHKVVVWSLEYCEFAGLLRDSSTDWVSRTNASTLIASSMPRIKLGNKYRAALCDMTDC